MNSDCKKNTVIPQCKLLLEMLITGAFMERDMLLIFIRKLPSKSVESRPNLILPRILYFVDRASRQKFLLITNMMHFFVYLVIHFISLNVSRT